MQGHTALTRSPATDSSIAGFRIEAPFKQGVLPASAINSNLSAYARLAIVALTFFGESSWPAHRTIARFMASSLTTARKALRELRDKDWLSIEPHRIELGIQTTNTYVLHEPGRQAAPRYRHTIPPYRQAIPIKNQNSSEEKKEEKNGVPQTETPISSKPIPPETAETGKVPIAVVDRLRDLFAELSQKAIGHAPPVERGRDRRIIGKLVRQYHGEKNAEAIIRDFVAYRARKEKVITMIALAAAAEAVFQRSRAGQGMKTSREHPEVRRHREWQEHLKRRQEDTSGVPPQHGPEAREP